jgi:hypothetical protein
VPAGADAVTERCSLQGSGDSFVRKRVVPSVYDDERADGQYVPVKKLCWRLSVFSRRSLEGRKRSHETGSGEPVFCGSGSTAVPGRVSSHGQGRRRFFAVKGSMDWRGTIQECSAPQSVTTSRRQLAVW